MVVVFSKIGIFTHTIKRKKRKEKYVHKRQNPSRECFKYTTFSTFDICMPFKIPWNKRKKEETVCLKMLFFA